MKEVIEGKRSPYIFHMSWTKNKDNKQRFYQQLGDWYVNEDCVNKPLEELAINGKKDLTEHCCASEPIVLCHYRDKPSKISCKDSPSIDKNGKSFW